MEILWRWDCKQSDLDEAAGWNQANISLPGILEIILVNTAIRIVNIVYLQLYIKINIVDLQF